MASPVRLT